MFRLQDNVPNVYVNESRDFQLFCRIYDYVNNAVMVDISSILNILDPLVIDDSLLQLYCAKIGFFTKLDISSDILRKILKAFPLMMKYKGTETAAAIAIAVLLRSQTTEREVFQLLIKNSQLNIYINILFENENILKELFKYILPVGMTYKINKYSTQKFATEYAVSSDSLIWYVADTSSISQAITNNRSGNTDFDYDISDSDVFTKDNFFDKTFSTVSIVNALDNSGMSSTDPQFDTDSTGTERSVVDMVDENDIHMYPQNGGNNG